MSRSCRWGMKMSPRRRRMDRLLRRTDGVSGGVEHQWDKTPLELFRPGWDLATSYGV